MINLHKFITSKEQPLKIQVSKPDVPLHWGGFYAAHRVGDLYQKRWYATNKGKNIKKEELVLPVAEAHKIWNDYLNKKGL